MNLRNLSLALIGVILMFAADGFVETCYSYAELKGRAKPPAESATDDEKS